MNFVIIAVDCLRADRLGCCGYHRNTTPFLDSMAEESHLFEQFFAPAIPTQPSFTTTFTGQLPTTHGIVAHRGRWHLDDSAPFLPEILKQHGYATAAVDNLADQHQPWFSRGFDTYLNPRQPGTYPDCFLYNEAAINWLEHHGQDPFLLCLHYWDPHTPYMPPPHYRSLFYEGDPTTANRGSLDRFYNRPLRDWWVSDWLDRMAAEWPNAQGKHITDLEFVRSQYDAEVRCADDGIKELTEALDRLGILDDTAILVYGDHGEELGEHGVFFDHHGLYDTNIHVPLLVKWPEGDRRGKRHRGLVQHTDIAPTLLDAAQVTIPPEMDGFSLVPVLETDAQLQEKRLLLSVECTWMGKWAVRDENWKYIRARVPDFYNGPMEELYDLKEDPGEQHNLAEKVPEIARQQRDKLESELWIRLAKGGHTEDPVLSHGITLGKGMYEGQEKGSIGRFMKGGFDFELLPDWLFFLKKGPIHKFWKMLPPGFRSGAGKLLARGFTAKDEKSPSEKDP